ncbi:MAG: NUDIX hydrolase [Candidatus Zixiibacteriota bacterium]|nr:MAG: NUDIX hydrolase [candidate division Zixibacteria bacterium]
MKTPLLTVDIIIIYPDGDFILIKRRNEPFKGQWAIPGGFVEIGETVEQAAVREAREETGLDVRLEKLVGVYSDPNRDPRGHTVSVAFLASPVGGELKADTDAVDVLKIGEYESLPIAFDHKDILRDALLK